MSKAQDNITELNDLGTYTVSSFMKTVVDDATAAAARTTLGAAASGVNSDITALNAMTSGTPFRKNALINGDFQIWQETTTFPAIGDGAYSADMWVYSKVGTMVHSVSQSSDVPTIAEAGRKIPFSLLVDCTTADATVAAGDFAVMLTHVEGYNFVHIAGVGLCLQFWHKHTKAGTYCVAFGNSGNDRTFVREYTQDVADTWEFASVLMDASPTAGTWDYTNNFGLRVLFCLTAGTSYQTTAGSWQTGQFFGTANQVNACDDVANNFRIAGVQLEKGSVATEFDVRTFQDELALCQRYYEKSYNYEVVPGTVGTQGMAYQLFSSAGATTNYLHVGFKTRKRTPPTITIYSPNVGTAGSITDYAAAADVAGAISGNTGSNGFSLGGVAVAPGCNWGAHWTANARM